MKLLAFIFSLLTFALLSLTLVNEIDNESNTASFDVTTEFKLPPTLPVTLLPAEEKWRALLKKKEPTNEKIEPEKTEFNNALTIGNKHYKLFGVFDNEKSLFVLLKSEDNKMLKLSLGDKLQGDFALIEINNNTIVFSDNNERIEYKLFEPKNYVKK